MDFVNLWDFEEYARKYLPKQIHDYYSSGATDQQTLHDNVDAYQRIRIRPRVLKGVEQIDTSSTVLGHKVSSPILVAPTAMQRMAHDDGEKATARACAKAGTIMCLSSWATTSLEEVNEAAPDGLRWFQLYIYNDRVTTQNLVKRAEAAGYKAIVLTVDTPILGRREADVKNGFALPPHLQLANFTSSVLSKGVVGGQGKESGLAAYVAGQIDKSLQWKDIAWLKSLTKLPIIVKGIHTAEDAELAIQHGVNAIWVSNHGARQLDGVLAAIDILPEVIQAAKGRVEVYVDGGIRRGTSVFKALAIGAKAVFVGRPVLWGLAAHGESGVSSVLRLLNQEFTTTMALTGCKSIPEISSNHVILPKLSAHF